MSDPDPEQCPECEKPEVERLISAVGFRLKGSGWYETDFKQSHRHNIAGGGGEDRTRKKKSGAGTQKRDNKAFGAEKSTGKSDAGKKSGKTSGTAA